jgi:MoxR-like ATPase
MNEETISIDHHTYPLPEPFMVLATQVAVSRHVPLPSRSFRRFLMRISIGYPDATRTCDPAFTSPVKLRTSVVAADVSRAQAAVEEVRVDPALVGYVLGIVAATRRAPAVEPAPAPGAARRSIPGAGGRTRRAATREADHIKELAVPVLAHRPVARRGHHRVEREEETAPRSSNTGSAVNRAIQPLRAIAASFRQHAATIESWTRSFYLIAACGGARWMVLPRRDDRVGLAA